MTRGKGRARMAALAGLLLMPFAGATFADDQVKTTSGIVEGVRAASPAVRAFRGIPLDRKSTRLNSSHVAISYAVFCLKKNTNSHAEMLHAQQLLAAAHLASIRSGLATLADQPAPRLSPRPLTDEDRQTARHRLPIYRI